MKNSTSTNTDKATEFFILIADSQFTISQLKKRQKQGKFLTLAQSKRLLASNKIAA
jgi:hypothetical protein